MTDEASIMVNWQQLTAQTAVLGLVGGFIMKAFWTKVDAKIDQKNNQQRKEIDEELDKRDIKRSTDKERMYQDINGLGQKIQAISTEMEIQKREDMRHDKELDSLRDNHKDLDARFNAVVEKIFLKIEEVKDLIITKYTVDK